MVVFNGLADLRTRHGREFTLAPGSSPIRMIDHDGLRFDVIMREVHEDFGDARLQVLDQVHVVVVPAGGGTSAPGE